MNLFETVSKRPMINDSLWDMVEGRKVENEIDIKYVSDVYFMMCRSIRVDVHVETIANRKLNEYGF